MRLSVGLGLSVAVLALGCSSSSGKRRVSDLDAGSDTGASRGGGAGSGGRSGNGGTSGSSGGGDASAQGGASDAGNGGRTVQDASLDGSGTGGADSGADGGGRLLPVVEVDPSCTAPKIQTALSPEAEGLPSTGLTLWLRADRGVYMTAANGVCAWVDQSEHGAVFRDAGSGQPLWQAGGVGERAAIQFTAASGPMTIDSVLGLPPTSGRTLIAVIQLIDTTTRFQALMQGQTSTAGTYVNLDANTYGTTGSLEGVYVTNNSYDSQLPTSTAPRVHVFGIATMEPGTSVISTITYRVNGAPQTLTRTPAGTGRGPVEDFSDANFTLVGNAGNGLIAEALLYDHALDKPEQTAIEQALEVRYGIIP